MRAIRWPRRGARCPSPRVGDGSGQAACGGSSAVAMTVMIRPCCGRGRPLASLTLVVSAKASNPAGAASAMPRASTRQLAATRPRPAATPGAVRFVRPMVHRDATAVLPVPGIEVQVNGPAQPLGSRARVPTMLPVTPAMSGQSERPSRPNDARSAAVA